MDKPVKFCAAQPNETCNQATPCSYLVPPPHQTEPPPPNTCFPASPVVCQPVDNNNPVDVKILDKPSIIPDMSQPIFCSWPQDPAPPIPKPENKPNLLDMIPDSIVPQVITVIHPGDSNIIKPTAPHKLCPDAQCTLTIDPPQSKEPEIRIPEFKVGVRPPHRCWVQCVESQLINDQVRRPLARFCHTREMPPLVLPCHEFERMKLKMTERERRKAEDQQRKIDYECEKLKSRYRHSLWNNTTESIIARKQKLEQEKERNERESNEALIAQIHEEKERHSHEQIARANKLMLYRKGLIRDFHAAMANSKMLKEIADTNAGGDNRHNNELCNRPYWNQICMQKMWEHNKRPEYIKVEKKKKHNPKLLEVLQADENRVKEREAEIQKELCEVKCLALTCPPPLPEAYLKYIEEPKCDDGDKARRQAKLRDDLFSEIHDKLATDAFIEAHENEIDRQACEFNKYKMTVDRMRKEKEAQLIRDKVNYNIMMSEKAGAALVKAKAEKQARANDCDSMKEQWESEWEAKVEERKEKKDRLMGHIYKDFWERRNVELCKQQMADPSRQWARERLVAVENYEQECERKDERRKKAEEVALYHQAQIADRKCREMREKHLNDVWGCKIMRQYDIEIGEMKKYANDCIQDWSAKGRPIKPLIQAMKRWDYDAGMYPFANPMNLQESKDLAKSTKDTNCPSYESTSKRLGFSECGGT